MMASNSGQALVSNLVPNGLSSLWFKKILTASTLKEPKVIARDKASAISLVV